MARGHEIPKEIAQIGRPHDKEVSDQDVTKGPERDDLIQKLSDTLVKPLQQFTDGLLTVHEWIPVLLVTTVEAYLKDVLIYAAKVDACDHGIFTSNLCHMRKW